MIFRIAMLAIFVGLIGGFYLINSSQSNKIEELSKQISVLEEDNERLLRETAKLEVLREISKEVSGMTWEDMEDAISAHAGGQ